MILSVTGKEQLTSSREVLTDLATDANLNEAVRNARVANESPMTSAEFDALADLEAKIADGWWKIGRSFAEIKAKKLYRQTKDGTHRTWEEYCKTVHSLTKQRVDTIIRAADVRETLETETKVSVLPETVSQAAELTGLEPEEMAAAAQEAVNTAVTENRSPTAHDYRQAAAKFKPRNMVRRAAHADKPDEVCGSVTQVVRTRPARGVPVFQPAVNRTEFEVEVRIGFKLSVPDHVSAEAVSEAIRLADRWTVGIDTPFEYEMSERGVVVSHVRPWDNSRQ